MLTLVTGGTGLLGLNVVRKLVARGERVRLLVRPTQKPRLGLEGLDVEIAPGDITERESVQKAMAGVSRVYHAPAEEHGKGTRLVSGIWLSKRLI